MHLFTKLYIGAGVLLLLLFGLVRLGGGFAPQFGRVGDVNLSARQGYWYTYTKPTPTRSPGSSGGGYGGSGGYSGGK